MKKCILVLALFASAAALAQPSCLICDIPPGAPATMTVGGSTGLAMQEAPILLDWDSEVLMDNQELSGEQWATLAVETRMTSEITVEVANNQNIKETEGRVRDRQIPATAPRPGFRTTTVMVS